MIVKWNSAHHIKSVAIVTAAHAACTVLLWIWSFGVAMGLGFKDKVAWSAFDHFQASMVPALTLLLTTPGRFMIFEGWVGIVAPLIANSVLWGIVIVWLVGSMRRHRFVG